MSVIANIQDGYVPTSVIRNITALVLSQINFASSVQQSQVVGLDSALTNKADDSAVLHLLGNEITAGTKVFSPNLSTGVPLITKGLSGQTGDLIQIQYHSGLIPCKVDSSGVFWSDQSVNTGGFLWRVTPNDSNTPYSYNHVVNSFDSGASGLSISDPQMNCVYSQGWNIGPGGGAADPSLPFFRDGWESHFYQAPNTQPQFERHVGSCFFPGAGEVRPITIGIQQYSPATLTQAVKVQMNAYGYNHTLEDTSTQIVNTYRIGTTVSHNIWGDDSNDTNLYPLNIIGYGGGARQDLIGLGRKTSTNTEVTVYGTGTTNLNLSTSSNTATIQNDSHLNLIAPTSGDVNLRIDGYWRVESRNAGTTYALVDPNGGMSCALGGVAQNFGFFRYTGSDWGAGVGVIYLGNATTVPSANPSNGCLLYSNAGVPTWRQSDGTIYALNNFARLSGSSQTVSASTTFSSKILASAAIDVTADGNFVASYLKAQSSASSNNLQQQWIGGKDGLLFLVGLDVSTGSGLKTFEFYSNVVHATVFSLDGTSGSASFAYAPILPTVTEASIPNGGIAWSSDNPGTLKCRTPSGTLKTISLS